MFKKNNFVHFVILNKVLVHMDKKNFFSPKKTFIYSKKKCLLKCPFSKTECFGFGHKDGLLRRLPSSAIPWYECKNHTKRRKIIFV